MFADKESNHFYEGDWYNDLQHGNGTELIDKGAHIYAGQYKAGKITGFGVYQSEGNKYVGDF